MRKDEVAEKLDQLYGMLPMSFKTIIQSGGYLNKEQLNELYEERPRAFELYNVLFKERRV